MPSPKTDDFRIEREDERLVVTFTPDGRSYTFRIEGDQLSDPVTSSVQTGASGYADDEVRRAATELARLALKGAP